MRVEYSILIVALVLAVPPASGQVPGARPSSELGAGLSAIALESADGGRSRMLSEFRGKTVLLVVVGQDSIEAGGRLMAGVGPMMADRPDVARAMVADLDGVPGLVKGIVRRGVGESHRAMNRRIEEGLARQGRPVLPRDRAITLLDWGGAVAKDLGVSGKTQSTYHAFVVDKAGKVVMHLAQSPGDPGERASIARAVEALRMAEGGSPN